MRNEAPEGLGKEQAERGDIYLQVGKESIKEEEEQRRQLADNYSAECLWSKVRIEREEGWMIIRKEDQWTGEWVDFKVPKELAEKKWNETIYYKPSYWGQRTGPAVRNRTESP